MHENQLTRRTFLLMTATGTLITLLDNCSGASTKPTSTSTPSPQSSSTLQQFLPGSISPTGLGVNIHFTEPWQDYTKKIAEAGFGFVRIDFPWSDVERQKGVYDFSTQENLVKALAEYNIRTLAILAYGNPLYDNSAAPFHIGPHTDEVRQAFASFAAAAAAKFKGKGMIWEIWNEPNNPDFWQPNPNADDYMKLAQTTIKAIRQVDTDVSIIAPAATTFPLKLDAWNFLEHCFKLGLLEQIDVVSIHPYRDKPPETVADDYKRLRALVAHYASEGKKNIPTISSEWGYPATTTVSRDYQAALLVRQFLINSMNGVPLSIWYDWHDDGQDPQNPQNNFGVLTWNNQPKSAYLGVQTLTNELKGFRFIESQTPPSRGDYDLLFASGKVKKRVLWTINNPHPVRLSVNAPSIVVVSMLGERQVLTPTGGTLVIEVTGSPQYLLTGS